jgi:hypothetical protein
MLGNRCLQIEYGDVRKDLFGKIITIIKWNSYFLVEAGCVLSNSIRVSMAPAFAKALARSVSSMIKIAYGRELSPL